MAPPRVIGSGWELQNVIGSGSFAVVWRAQHKETGVVAAVKEIYTAKLTGKLQLSLASEVSVLQRTAHRNLVGLLDLVKEEDRLFLILEFCAGGDLGQFLRRCGPVPEASARHLLQQLASGLQALRAQNLMHRDLKPQNLLLCDSSSTPLLKIADFGFARSLQPQGLAETLCGSPLYMAPEILQFHKYDAKADLWSVGAIFFELLTGKPPFNGANHLQLLQNIERGDGGRLPASVANALSPPCKQLLQQLLRRNPLERISHEEFFSHPFLTHALTQTPAPHPHPATAAQAALGAHPQAPQEQVTLTAMAANMSHQHTHTATQPVGPPRVAYPGPLLGVHEATGISVRTAVMRPPNTTPFTHPTSFADTAQGVTDAPTGSDGVTGVASHQQGATAPHDASTAANDGLQYTDIDLGPSPSPSPGPPPASTLSPYRVTDHPPGALSVIEEVDDYVVISGEPSPASSTYGVQGVPTAAGVGVGGPSGGGGGAASSGVGGSVSRGRGAWDALSRVGPALLQPRLMASAAASQLRSTAGNQSWAGQLGQLASQVTQSATGRVYSGSFLSNRSSTSPQPPGSASLPTLQPTDTSPREDVQGGADTEQSAQAGKDSGSPQDKQASAPPALPAPSLTQLMRIPDHVNLIDLLTRVLHILGQDACKAWDTAVGEAELAAAAAAEQAGTAQPPQGETHTGSATGALSASQHTGAAASQPAVSSVPVCADESGECDNSSAVQAAVDAAARVLRPAAAQLVSVHLLCGQLLKGALGIASGEGPGKGGLQSGPGGTSGVVGATRSALADSPQQRAVLSALGKSVLGALSGRTSQASLQLNPSDPLVEGTALLYQTAAQLCRTAALEELMGQYGVSIQHYAKAADLLLFLLLTACKVAVHPDAQQAGGDAVKVSGTQDGGQWSEVLSPLSGSQAGAVHQLYVAVRIRQSACMRDLNTKPPAA